MSGDLKTIRAVIDRVLWTAGATKQNRALLAKAIADALAAPLPAEQPSNPVPLTGDFQRGVIAALAVLNSHGYPHGSVYHDSIISTVGDSIYAVADDEDYDWAGLDPRKKPKNVARIVGQQTKGGGK